MTWTSKELVASTCHGSLTLGGTSMNTKAWASLNNYILWSPASRRGENSLIPDLAGRIPNPRRKDQTQRTLECVIIGDCNAVGTPHSSREAGLATNFMSLRSSVFNWGGTTLSASLTLPNGGTLSGVVQVIEVTTGSTDVVGALTFTIDLVLPYGELT